MENGGYTKPDQKYGVRMSGAIIQDLREKNEFFQVPDSLSDLIGPSFSEKEAEDNKLSNSLKIDISIFKNISGKNIEKRNIVWDDIEKLLSGSCIYMNKLDCPLLKLAVFGNKRTAKGSLRSDRNIREIYGIEGDYDAGEITIDEDAAILKEKGVESCFYTTPRHTSDKPRWRVLVPLKKGYPPTERSKFVKIIDSYAGRHLGRGELYLKSVLLFWQSPRCSL